jgi:lipoprotein-anchoring transpeptidase ErfK/SrfK
VYQIKTNWRFEERMFFDSTNKITKHKFIYPFILSGLLILQGCVPPENANSNANVTNPAVNTNANNANSTARTNELNFETPVTFPVLEAMLADEEFVGELKTKLQLSDEQINNLKNKTNEAVRKVRENYQGEDYSGSTRASMETTAREIREVLGDEKAAQFFELVRSRWSNSDAETANTNAAKPNAVPADTRVVVNAPAYRMDVFQDGKLLKSYKIGIGYPEFPLPSGLRRADTIIFNPTWTPPDEPWVKGDVKPGETVEAGSKNNPLGPIKIPIGLPSLIHGGKSPARLGTFASHGCVGLTNGQIQEFAVDLAAISGSDLTKEAVLNYAKQKTETENFKLGKSIPVELRYETIVVEDGKLKIYRDVYERGTNTEENLRRVLDSYGVSLDSLNEQDRKKILDGLEKMAYDAKGEKVEADANTNANSANANAKNSNSDGKVTKNIKGQKEVVFELAELKGKGYPAPVQMRQ